MQLRVATLRQPLLLPFQQSGACCTAAKMLHAPCCIPLLARWPVMQPCCAWAHCRWAARPSQASCWCCSADAEPNQCQRAPGCTPPQQPQEASPQFACRRSCLLLPHSRLPLHARCSASQPSAAHPLSHALLCKLHTCLLHAQPSVGQLHAALLDQHSRPLAALLSPAASDTTRGTSGTASILWPRAMTSAGRALAAMADTTA